MKASPSPPNGAAATASPEREKLGGSALTCAGRHNSSNSNSGMKIDYCLSFISACPKGFSQKSLDFSYLFLSNIKDSKRIFISGVKGGKSLPAVAWHCRFISKLTFLKKKGPCTFHILKSLFSFHVVVQGMVGELRITLGESCATFAMNVSDGAVYGYSSR